VAITVEHTFATLPCRTTDVPAGIRLQEFIDNGALYGAPGMTVSQLATLRAIAGRIVGSRESDYPGASVNPTIARGAGEFRSVDPTAVNYSLGLDELDTIARTRTSYAFAELPDEIQDAILGLIRTGDLTSRELDLAGWVDQLYALAAAS
jgi:Gluconate 2-dehydrogenase subunit 3